MHQKRESFGGRIAVLLSMAGSAIGLGNIWRFPYMVGENGGAAYVIMYIVASLFLSLPVFLSEAIIGRASQSNTFGAIKKYAPGKGWSIFAYIAVLAPLILLSYYSVIGGWSVNYLVKSATTGFLGVEKGLFETFISSTWGPLLFHTIFMLATLLVVLGGVKDGIEKFNKYSMPLLLVLIVVIMIYSLTLPRAGEGVRYLVKPDFTKLTPSVIAAAMGQSFFSLSLGIGAILTYASYMKKEENIMLSGVSTLGFDLLFALIAGFAIMPALFSAGMEPGSGPGLVFETLPFVFGKMGASAPLLGRVVAILFFLTIVIAALTSAISLLEVGVAYLMEEKNMSRKAASILVFGICWFLGTICSLSYGPLGGIRIFGKNVFDLCDYAVSNVLMVLVGLFFALFVGWKMDKTIVKQEFTSCGKHHTNKAIFGIVYFFIKYIAPIAILIVFVSGLIG